MNNIYYKLLLLFLLCLLVSSIRAQDFYSYTKFGLGKGDFSLESNGSSNLTFQSEYGFYYNSFIGINFPVNVGVGINFSQNNGTYRFQSEYPELNKGYRYTFDSKQHNVGVNLFYRKEFVSNLMITPYVGLGIIKHTSGLEVYHWKSESVLKLPPKEVFNINLSENLKFGYTAGLEISYQIKNIHSIGAGISFIENFELYSLIKYISPVTKEIATAKSKGSYLSYFLTYSFLINPSTNKESNSWQNIKNNEIFVEFGGIGGHFSLNFEHKVKRYPSSTVGIKFGVGAINDSGIESLEFPLSVSNSFGKRNHFFNTEIGFRATKPYSHSPGIGKLGWEYALFTGFGYKVELKDKIIFKVMDYPFLTLGRFSSSNIFDNTIGISMGIKI